MRHSLFIVVLLILGVLPLSAQEPLALEMGYPGDQLVALSVEESDLPWPYASSALESAPDFEPRLAFLLQTPPPEGDFIYGEAVEQLLIDYRLSQGGSRLESHPALRQASSTHNAYMVAIQQLCHTCPGEVSVGNQIFEAGYTGAYAWGQIITLNPETPTEAMGEWINSDGHRRAILNPIYVHVGCAFRSDPWAWLWTCDLAAGGADSEPPSPITPTPPFTVTATWSPTRTSIPLSVTPGLTATRWLPPTRTPLPTARYTPPVVPTATLAPPPTSTHWLPPTRTLLPSPTAGTCEWRWQWGYGWVCDLHPSR
jgi:hypothetical protein